MFRFCLTKKHAKFLCEKVYEKAFKDGATNDIEKYSELKNTVMQQVEGAISELEKNDFKEGDVS